MFANGLELLVEVGGRNIPEFGKEGRTYVEGRKENRYALKFRNNRAERVLLVPTVDNLSVIDGEPHHVESPGYVVQGYSSITIRGWRISNDELRAFKFLDKSGSVAGKMVGTENCGVIGAQVYLEVPAFQWMSLNAPTFTVNPGYTAGTPFIGIVNAGVGSAGLSGINSPGVSVNTIDYSCLAGSQSTAVPDFNLGTGHAESIMDHVVETSFAKSLLLASFEIYYSDREGLLKAGIQVDKIPAVARFPQAFGKFCKLPA